MPESDPSVKKSVDERPSKDKKSNTWIWIVVAGVAILVVFFIIIIIVAAFGGFSSPDNSSSSGTCTITEAKETPAYSTNASAPILVVNGPNYLTNPGVVAGSTNNKQIKTSNAIGWVLLNNSPDRIQLYYYYISSDNVSRTLYTIASEPGSGLIWTDMPDSPVFIGMTIQVYNYTNPQKLSSNKYTIPSSGIDPSTDILFINYDSLNTISGSICTLPS